VYFLQFFNTYFLSLYINIAAIQPSVVGFNITYTLLCCSQLHGPCCCCPSSSIQPFLCIAAVHTDRHEHTSPAVAASAASHVQRFQCSSASADDVVFVVELFSGDYTKSCHFFWRNLDKSRNSETVGEEGAKAKVAEEFRQKLMGRFADRPIRGWTSDGLVNST